LACELAETHGIETLAVHADLRSTEAMQILRKAIGEREIGLFVNNAGVGALGEFLESRAQDLEALIAINATAPTLLSLEYGQLMARRKRGGIIMVSSLAAAMGGTGIPGMWHYPATKGYSLMLGDALDYELGKHGVDVCSLLPGFTAPRFTDNVDISRVPLMKIAPAPGVVKAVLAGLGRQAVVVPGFMSNMMWRMSGLMPRALTIAMFAMVNRRIEWRAAPVSPA
jgi:short-subunit dehydrogenase